MNQVFVQYACMLLYILYINWYNFQILFFTANKNDRFLLLFDDVMRMVILLSCPIGKIKLPLLHSWYFADQIGLENPL